MTDQELKKLKDDLWHSADVLRSGAHLAANRYGQPILGLIFLRYADILYNSDLTENYKTIIREAVDDFEKDRKDYIVIFNQNKLEDLDEDADGFKSKTLRNECPIIRKTLANRKAKELDKYRVNFSQADPDWLLNVVYNLCVFGDEYKDNYDPNTYENAKTYQDLKMELLDTDNYTAYGVIGGGIKTHMLYKVYPAMFPNRSRIWIS